MLRDLLLTTPSAPLRKGIFLLRRSLPSLKRRGMDQSRNQPHSPSAPRRNLWDSSDVHSVFSGRRRENLLSVTSLLEGR